MLRAPTKSIGRARGSRSQHRLPPWLVLLLVFLFAFIFLLCDSKGMCTDVAVVRGLCLAEPCPAWEGT